MAHGNGHVRFGHHIRIVALAALSAAAVGVAAYQIERVFEPEYSQWTIALIPVLSLAVGLLMIGRWWPLRVAVHAVAVIGAMTYAIREAGGEVPGDLARSIVRGLTDTLSTRWPVPVLATAVGGFAFAVAVAGAVAVELALARRFAVSLLMPSMLLLVVVALLAAPAGPPSAEVLVGYSLLGLAVLRLAALTRSDLPHHARGAPREAERRSRITMAIVGSTAVVVGLIPPAFESAASEADRFDPRDRLPEEIVALDEISPLSRLDEWRERNPSDTVFSTTSNTEARWRLVGLTRYDGRSWMPADDYRPSGAELRPPTDDLPSEEVTVQVGALDARWLPAPDRPLTVSEPVYVDGTSSGLLVDDVPEPGSEYVLTVEPFDVGAGDLVGAAAGEPRVVFVDGFTLPPALQQLASTITAGAEAPYERALRISTYLRERYRLVTDSPAGHSLNILQIFLEQTKSGRDEQFVAAFGVLAAAAGLPVRISLGFDTTTDPAGGTVAQSDDVLAWPEVEFADVGWVPFNPIPEGEDASATTGGQAVAPVSERPDDVPPTVPPPVPSTVPPLPEELQDEIGFTVPTVVSRSLVGLSAVLMVLISYVLVVTRLKSSRRSRRRFADVPEQRVTGAFRSGVDVLIDLGSTAPTSKTDRELVATGVTKLGDAADSLTPVAVLATQAVYDKPEPNEDLAEDAWEWLHRFEHQTVKDLGRWRYVRAKLSLRSFRRGLPD